MKSVSRSEYRNSSILSVPIGLTPQSVNVLVVQSKGIEAAASKKLLKKQKR